jgi:dynein heavy chain
MYLENIFSAEDIQKQLPNESKLFQKVDRFWRDTMAKTHRNPSILDTCASEGLLRRFQSNNKMLDDIQKCLEDYLETKRAAFPRFYFLSNDELLQILSQTRNAQAVQPHLRKCFDNMASIVFTKDKNSRTITAMVSADGELVQFSKNVMAEGNVEFWLTDIEKMMVKSLYDKGKNCLEVYPENALERRDWFFSHPAQLVLIIDQVFWTKGCTEAIEEIEKGKNKKALDEWLDFSVTQIAKMVEIVRSDLTEHQRTLMGALIVLDVHAREVVKKMISVKVNNINAFEWGKQLRYYWEEEEDKTSDCFVRQTNTRFRYGYEFLGNGPRLVITPLTDKCYMTLTSALHLNYGGNPQGPAGTGKTESTKDLSKALAIQ